MAGYKETPRQKMIGMMYLVLTALLALNVSKEILEAFVNVNSSIELTNENFSKKVKDVYGKFDLQLQLQKEKVTPYWNKAQAVKKLSSAMANYLDSLKYVIIVKSINTVKTVQEAKTHELNIRNDRIDNYDDPTNFFFGNSEDGSGGEAIILKNKLEKYKKDMMALVDPKYQSSVKFGLETSNPKDPGGYYYDASHNKVNWAQHNFYRTILAACLTILNKYKAEVYNAEFDVINILYSSISAQDFKFDTIQAKVIPKSRFVFAGDQYEAEVLVAGYQTKDIPIVRYVMGTENMTPAMEGNARTVTGEGGIVSLTFQPGGEGLQKYAGYIQIKDPSGTPKNYYFSDSYIVGKRVIAIAPTKMLVFYKGIDNPVRITAPGGAESLDVKITYGTIRKEGSDYVVFIPATGGPTEATLTVNANYAGHSIPLGSEKFRLKMLPYPTVMLGNKSEGAIARNVVAAFPYLTPIMPQDFAFEIKYKVTGFTFTTTVAGQYIEYKTQGNTLTNEILSVIKNAKTNQRITFEDIYVTGPDGTRKLQISQTFKML